MIINQCKCGAVNGKYDYGLDPVHLTEHVKIILTMQHILSSRFCGFSCSPVLCPLDVASFHLLLLGSGEDVSQLQVGTDYFY